MSRKKKRRAYLLLEVLIAFALVALCLFPLIKPHLFMLQYEKKYSDNMQLQRIARNFFYDFKQMLFENQMLAWDQLNSECLGKVPGTYPLYSKKGKTLYEADYQIVKIDECEKKSNGKNSEKNNGKYFLLEISLNLHAQGSKHSHPYTFALLVKNPSLVTQT